jgi:cytochrome c biogenesis protein CcmG, thiol:disulfide interchange protein DsbE
MKVFISSFLFFLLPLFLLSQIKTAEEQKYDSLMAQIHNCVGRNFVFEKAKGVDGKTYSMKDIKGKTVLINFWFSECKPCVAEFEYLKKILVEYKDRKDFLLLSFTFDSREKAKRTAMKYGLQYPVLLFTEEKTRQLNCEHGFPTNLIVDKTGKIAYLKNGGFADEQDFEDTIKKNIDGLMGN